VGKKSKEKTGSPNLIASGRVYSASPPPGFFLIPEHDYKRTVFQNMTEVADVKNTFLCSSDAGLSSAGTWKNQD
jgi:hypothetical protein